MTRSTKRLGMSAGLLAAAAAVLSLTPQAGAAQYNQCGDTGTNVCSKTELCFSAGFIETCKTIQITYYNR